MAQGLLKISPPTIIYYKRFSLNNDDENKVNNHISQLGNNAKDRKNLGNSGGAVSFDEKDILRKQNENTKKAIINEIQSYKKNQTLDKNIQIKKENKCAENVSKSNDEARVGTSVHDKNSKSQIPDVKQQFSDLKIKNGEKRGKQRRKRSLWSVKITFITFVLAIFFSFISELTSSTGNIVVTIMLLIFLILGSIVFDGIGVAVTACDLAPLVSMSSRRIYGSKTAVHLVRNAEKVANICNDVIGDIFGIISGACSIAIVLKILEMSQSTNQRIMTIAISSVVAALTVGGKAIVKDIAINNSKELVMFVARIAAVFSKEERKNKKNTNTNEER